MESQYDELAAYFLRVSIDVFGVYQSILDSGIHQGHKYKATTHCALLIALKGEADFRYDGTSYVMYPGRAILGGLNRNFEIIVHTAQFEYFLVHYLPIVPDPKQSLLMVNVNELHINMDAALLQMTEELRRLSTSLGNIELLEKKTLFYRLLNKTLLSERYQQNSESQPMMEQTIDYIRKHYMEALTLESLAEQHGMKAKYFSYLFQKYTGMGPINYLIKYRMNLAYELLMTASFSVREIAKSVGYVDAYYFSRLFKKHTGLAPTAVKQLGGNNPS
ncbi:AraC family transcriptional regulator [Paenibacillus psychroresistens]|uniref:AraC family transcriptional regulator n=1 Tax=Paenibacillus psychroresistens TaxID=1778678 RepID=A0A6B8RDZ8_9BACL|nr:AraC family transcriptional regulator [Paenibacillus psychroresistens]QGQ94671.1 AraC family transcriptional regulator [Paenibacillus psychroresistens]